MKVLDNVGQKTKKKKKKKVVETIKKQLDKKQYSQLHSRFLIYVIEIEIGNWQHQPKVEDKVILYFGPIFQYFIKTIPYQSKSSPKKRKKRVHRLWNSESCRGRWCSRQGKRGLPTLQWSASKSTALASRSPATKTRSSPGALACTSLSLSLSLFTIFFFFSFL